MASIVSVNPVKTSELRIQKGTEFYTLNHEGELHDAAGNKFEGAEAKKLLTKAAEEIEETAGTLSKEVHAAATATKFTKAEGLDKALAEALEKNLGSVKKISEFAAKNDHAAIMKELAENPEAKKFFGEKVKEDIVKTKFNFKTVDAYKAAKDGLQAIVEGEKPTVDAIKKHLTQHHDYLDHLDVHANDQFKLFEAGEHLDLAALKTEVKAGVDNAHTEIHGLLTDVADKAGEIKRLEKAPGIKPEKLTKEKAALAEMTKKYEEAIKGEFGPAGLKKASVDNEALVSEAKKASSSISSSIESTLKSFESGAKTVAKEGVGFIKTLYTHTAAGEKFGKVHNGKVAGLIAGTAILGYAIAGTGKKGKAADMNAEQVQAQLAAQQGQQPEVAGAAR